MAENKVKKCKCAYCDDRAFEVPKDIIEAIKMKILLFLLEQVLAQKEKMFISLPCIRRLMMSWEKIIIIHFLN